MIDKVENTAEAIGKIVQQTAQKAGVSLSSVQNELRAKQQKETREAIEKQMKKVSFVVVTCKRDAHFLADLIGSLPRAGSELIIFWTDCKERKDIPHVQIHELAKRGLNIQHHYTQYDSFEFGKAKNDALAKCNREWAFFLDSDERFLPWQTNLLVETLQVLTDKPDILGLYTTTYDTSFVCGKEFQNAYWRCNIFRVQEGVYFEGAVHESPELPIQRAGGLIAKTTIGIHHIGYNADAKEMRDKITRNLELLDVEEQRNGSSDRVREYKERSLDMLRFIKTQQQKNEAI